MIVILTGAGISKESGIATFRDSDGLWQNEKVEDIATPQGFERDPRRVYRFYNQRRRELIGGGIQPNEAHKALARLEAESKLPVLVVTQNVDNLHERAGTKNLIHMHGELLKARCMKCRAVMQWGKDMSEEDTCPECLKPGGLRPHIVWFGEMPLHMQEVEEALAKAKVFLSIGTSGNVYPAAAFAQIARGHGAHVVELNLEQTQGGELTFHEGLYGPATTVVPHWVDKYLEKQDV